MGAQREVAVHARDNGSWVARVNRRQFLHRLSAASAAGIVAPVLADRLLHLARNPTSVEVGRFAEYVRADEVAAPTIVQIADAVWGRQADDVW